MQQVNEGDDWLNPLYQIGVVVLQNQSKLGGGCSKITDDIAECGVVIVRRNDGLSLVAVSGGFWSNYLA